MLKKQATFADCGTSTKRRQRIAEVRQTKPPFTSPAADYFFGYSEKDLRWVETSIGSLIPLVPVAEKPCFYTGNAQGGTWTTFLNIIGGDVERLKRFEAHGLDTRLSAEEFLAIVEAGHYDKLLYLLASESESIRFKILFRVRRRDPSFGQQGPMSLRPQDDRVSDVEGFDPGSQQPCLLPDSSTLYLDLSAIAQPEHSHGPCFEGYFWLRVEKPEMRRRGADTIMKRLHVGWERVRIPKTIYQLEGLLPVVRQIDGRTIRLTWSANRLAHGTGDDKINKRIQKWIASKPVQRILAEAEKRIKAQDEWNPKIPAPARSAHDRGVQAPDVDAILRILAARTE